MARSASLPQNHRSVMKEVPLSLRQKYLSVVSKLATPGALGAALLLGSAAPGLASQDPAQPLSAQRERVSERLAAVRDAVSTTIEGAAQASDAAGERRLAWGNWGGGWGRGWGGGGYGYNPWNNWNNWRNGWHNWGNGWGNW